MKRMILISIFLFFFVLVFGQDHLETETTIPIPTINQVNNMNENEIYNYLEFLREETKLHREYTQWFYSMILTLLSALGVIVSALLVWLNWKSKEDIKKQVNIQFRESVEGIINAKIRDFDLLINSHKEKVAKQIEEINRMLLELSTKSNRINEQENKNNRNNEQFNLNALNGKNILWVDDYPENNSYPKEILEQAGIKFVLALDTEDAINILKKKKFDLIISDMGRGNNPSAGLDLLNEIKKIKIETPVIIFASSQALSKFGPKALELGAIEISTGITNLLSVIQKQFLGK